MTYNTTPSFLTFQSLTGLLLSSKKLHQLPPTNITLLLYHPTLQINVVSHPLHDNHISQSTTNNNSFYLYNPIFPPENIPYSIPSHNPSLTFQISLMSPSERLFIGTFILSLHNYSCQYTISIDPNMSKKRFWKKNDYCFKEYPEWKYSFEKCANVDVNCQLVSDIKEITTISIPPLINCDVNNEVSSRITYDTDINTHSKDVNKYCNKNVIHVVSPENSVTENVNIMKKQVLMKKTLSSVSNGYMNTTHNKKKNYHDCGSEMSITTEEKVILYQQEVRQHVKDMVEMEKRVHDWKVNVSPKSDKNNNNMNKMYNPNIISSETITTDPICNTRSVNPYTDSDIHSDSVTVLTGSLTYDKSVVSSIGFVPPIDDYDMYDSDTLGMTVERNNEKQEPLEREISMLSEDYMGNMCDYNDAYTNYNHYHQKVNKNNLFSTQKLIDYQYRRYKMKYQNMNQGQDVNQYNSHQHMTKSMNVNRRINNNYDNISQNVDMNFSQSQSKILERNQNYKGISENQLMIQNMNNEKSNNHRQFTCHNQNLNQGQTMSQDQNNNHRQLIHYNQNESQIKNTNNNGNRRGNSNMNNNVSSKNSRYSSKYSKQFRKNNSRLDHREYNWNKELQEEYRKSSQYEKNQRNHYANHINVGGIFGNDGAFDMTSMFCGAMGVGK